MELTEFRGRLQNIGQNVGGSEPLSRVAERAIADLRSRFEIDAERTIEDQAVRQVVALVEQFLVQKMAPLLRQRDEAIGEQSIRFAEQRLREAWCGGVDGMLRGEIAVIYPVATTRETNESVTYITEGGHHMEVSP